MSLGSGPLAVSACLPWRIPVGFALGSCVLGQDVGVAWVRRPNVARGGSPWCPWRTKVLPSRVRRHCVSCKGRPMALVVLPCLACW